MFVDVGSVVEVGTVVDVGVPVAFSSLAAVDVAVGVEVLPDTTI